MPDKPENGATKVTPEILEVNEIGSTKWLRLESLRWKDATGKVRVWDRAVRTTRVATADVDAAMVVGIKWIRRDNAGASGPEIPGASGPPGTRPQTPPSRQLGVVLVAQYRPAVGGYCVEFPAGLVDGEDGDVSVAGVRELYEETGYEGEALFCSPPLYLSPGMGNESVRTIVSWINANEDCPPPTQHLDDGEDITVIVLPLLDLRRQLDILHREKDYVIFDSVYTFAMGLELGLKLSNFDGSKNDDSNILRLLTNMYK